VQVGLPQVPSRLQLVYGKSVCDTADAWLIMLPVAGMVSEPDFRV
jgi:hypothetical protein